MTVKLSGRLSPRSFRLSLVACLAFTLTACTPRASGGNTPAPAQASSNAAIEAAPAIVRPERLIVLSDMYGICAYPVYSMKWTTERMYDISYGTLEVEHDDGKHKVNFNANVMLEGPFELDDRRARMSEAGYHWLEFGWLGAGNERFVWAYSLGKADRRNVMISYRASDPGAAVVAEHLADALVPCEARISEPKPKPLDPGRRPFTRG